MALEGVTPVSNYFTSALEDSMTPEQLHLFEVLSEVIRQTLERKTSIKEASDFFIANIQHDNIVQQIKEVLDMEEQLVRKPVKSKFIRSGCKTRRRPWDHHEDVCLIAAILHYGETNWKVISDFVGNGRTSSLCWQRWNCVLSPQVKTQPWTQEEEMKLLELTDKYGTKNWSTISKQMECRSDVQCRYRYHYLSKKRHLKGRNEVCTMKQVVTLPSISNLIYPIEKKMESKVILPSIFEDFGVGIPPDYVFIN